MCTLLCPDIYVDHYVLFLSRSLIIITPHLIIITPHYRCVILQLAAIHESLRIKCHYQHSILQHYYLLDTLVLI